ncbi:MAG: chromosome partitioning protein, partial [Brachymonas sp.]|nr:chromosome partitioning protein [Brachymonas sp.]
QSSRDWLRLRNPALPPIAAWAMEQSNVLRVPAGISHVVLDTPGGMRGLELARTVMLADAVLMPVCDSVFDRQSAAACHAELMTLPRIASGRCRLGAIGMRLDGRSNGAATQRAWAENLGMEYIGSLRDTRNYVRSSERGMTVFDLSTKLAGTDHAQWQTILDWLRPTLWPPVPTVEEKSRPIVKRTTPQSTLLRTASTRTPVEKSASAAAPAAPETLTPPAGEHAVPSFLRKNP